MNRLSAFTVILLSLMANACIGPSVSGSGHVVSETRNVSDFTKVTLEGTGHVFIEQGAPESVTVTGDDNLLKDIETEVRGSNLVLGERHGVQLRPSKDIVYKVTVGKLDGLALSGSGDMDAKGIQTASIKIDLSGSGDVSASGSGDEVDLSISGSGRFRGDGLKTKRARVNISGSGDAAVAPNDTLDATISGSGSIEYLGTPQIHQSISGSGSIRQH